VNPPQRLGKYTITEVIGSGAMGVVYKAFDPDIRRTVALKTIRRGHDDGSADAGASSAARFRNEAQAAGRLSHPGIVAVYEYGEDDGVAFIAMEYVEGQTLARQIGDGQRFSDAQIPVLMAQLLDALGHAHGQGVWHRDIKPANIILTRAGQLKIADFGVARIDGANLTQAQAAIGTPAYMAPEQFLGRAVDHRVDLYGAGVLLYLLLTGRPVFSGSTEALMYQVVHDKPMPPSAVAPLPRPAFYDALVAKALAKDPQQRFASASAFKAALLAGTGGGAIDPSTEETLLVPMAQGAGVGPSTEPPPQRTEPGLSTGAGRWDPAMLARLEALLARSMGPLAAVLVRRAARDCAELPALHARLAEQIGDAAARQAFLAALGGDSTGTRTLTTAQSGSRPAAPASLPLDDRLVEQATQLLARRIGPIAKIVVRKAAAQPAGREAFFAALALSVDDADARQKLLAELARL